MSLDFIVAAVFALVFTVTICTAAAVLILTYAKRAFMEILEAEQRASEASMERIMKEHEHGQKAFEKRRAEMRAEHQARVAEMDRKWGGR